MTTRSRYIRFFEIHRFTLLLGLIVVAFMTQAAAEVAGDQHAVVAVLYALVLLGAVQAGGERGWLRYATQMLIVIWLMFDLMKLTTQSPVLAAAAFIVTALVVGMVLASTLESVLFAKTRPTEVLAAVIFGYFLLALLFALLYSAVDLLMPNSFHLSGTAVRGELLYFSLVSLTTLGYGDIVGTNPLSRMLSALEAAAGGLYLAVFIARVINLFDRLR